MQRLQDDFEDSVMTVDSEFFCVAAAGITCKPNDLLAENMIEKGYCCQLKGLSEEDTAKGYGGIVARGEFKPSGAART